MSTVDLQESVGEVASEFADLHDQPVHRLSQ